MDSCETNRDHVVRDLRYLKSYGKVSNNQTIYEIAESALELLKEQEAIKPKEIAYAWRCGKCDEYLTAIENHRIRFCPYCGQAVKWDD